MRCARASGFRAAVTKLAVAVALIGLVVTSATTSASALPRLGNAPAAPFSLDDPSPSLPTNPDDPRCAAMPEVAQCQGGPFALPTGPLDPQCISMPTDAACAGGPYAIPSPTPPPPPPIAPPLIAPPPIAAPEASMPGRPGAI